MHDELLGVSQILSVYTGVFMQPQGCGLWYSWKAVVLIGYMLLPYVT